MTLYDDLGLPKGASGEEVKKAYRKAAHKTHPDKGGDVQKFQVVQHAYNVLGDPTKKEKYDRTGVDGQEISVRGVAMQNICSMILQMVEQSEPGKMDIVKNAHNATLEAQRKMGEHIKLVEKKIKKYEAQLKRFKHKGRSDDFISSAINQQILVCKNNIEDTKKAKQINDEMFRLLKEYEYAVDRDGEGESELQRLFSRRQ